jgi:ABC-type multidrug transport system fused ATPase/permease subunit
MTIREYLLLGVSPNLSVNEKIIKSALKTAMAIDFIEKFPDEENTDMGPQGMTLSLSQRIRVQLASFLVARPRPKLLLIEDVASCINDYKTRIKVQKAIYAVLSQMEETTAVFLTDHPLSLQNASRVIVLKDGKIFESGTH